MFNVLLARFNVQCSSSEIHCSSSEPVVSSRRLIVLCSVLPASVFYLRTTIILLRFSFYTP